MSGQDVTKQLSLLSIVSRPDDNPLLNTDMVVTLSERMERLESFLETIPEQFRTPNIMVPDENKSFKDKTIENVKNDATSSANSEMAHERVHDPRASYDGPPVTALDIRVGRIQRVWEHEEAEKLFCEEIDIGEDQPRMVASGLRPFFQKEDLEGRKVLVLCNLKERKLVGFPSHGMVLCASNADHSDVRFISPPMDAKVGERVTFPGWDMEEPMAENKLAKKKVFEQLAPFLRTSQHGVPEFLGAPFMTSAGVCTSPLPDASVS
jgi:methionine--tRNA ligase beta chain